MSAPGRTARWVVGGGRLVVRLLPRRVQKALDDRLFGAIFQVTRVTNDAYGWRPATPAGRPGEAARQDAD